MKLRHVDQEKLQNRTNTRRFSDPNQGPKVVKTQSSRSGETERVRARHGLPVEGRTARGGGTHGRAPLAPAGLFGFIRMALRFPSVFC